MNLYLVFRTDEIELDNYDSFVCAAYSEEEALNLYPRVGAGTYLTKINWDGDDHHYHWAHKKENVQVRLIGIADWTINETIVICSSLRAG